MNELRKLIRKHKVDAVFCYSSDRLSRTPLDADVLLNEYFSSGVSLYLSTHGLIEDIAEHRLIFGIESHFNDFWRRKIIEATNRGKKEVIESGVPIFSGNTKYGFDFTGTKADKQIFHIQEEADTIKLIYGYFVFEQWTVTQICDHFNNTNKPTRASLRKGFSRITKRWTPAMLYQIIKDPCNMGIMYAKRYGTNADGKQFIRPKEDWIQLNVPPIISQELWNKAQEILREGRKLNARLGINEYLIARKVKCLHCGASMVGKPNKVRGYCYFNYCCPQRGRFNRGCDNTQYKVSLVDTATWNFITELISNPHAMLAAYRDAQKVVDSGLQDAIDTIKQYDDAIAAYQLKISRYADLYADGGITKDLFREKKHDLDKQILAATKLRAEYSASINEQRITNDDIDYLCELAEKVNAIVSKGKDVSFARKKELIDALQITTALGVENGVKILYVYWAVYERRIDLQEFHAMSLQSKPRLHCYGANYKVITFRVVLR